jgi:hypothetical protein
VISVEYNHMSSTVSVQYDKNLCSPSLSSFLCYDKNVRRKSKTIKHSSSSSILFQLVSNVTLENFLFVDVSFLLVAINFCTDKNCCRWKLNQTFHVNLHIKVRMLAQVIDFYSCQIFARLKIKSRTKMLSDWRQNNTRKMSALR